MRYQVIDELAIREALASTRMEGLTVTPEIERNIRLLGQAGCSPRNGAAQKRRRFEAES